MKTVVVTGANRGIGFEFCRQYLQKEFNVIGLCRKKSKAFEALKINIIDGIDVTDPKSLKKAQKELSGTKIDLLINNAGIFLNDTLGSLDPEEISKQFYVNALGPLMMTEALMPHLQKGATVAMVTSLMGSIADNGSGGYYGYRMSKAALNMAGMSLSRDLQKSGITVLLLHPGYVKTDMTQHLGNVLPEESVKGLIQQIESAKKDNVAHFRGYNNKELPW